MPIPDGILPLHVTLGGYAVAMATTIFCIRKLREAGGTPDNSDRRSADQLRGRLFLRAQPMLLHGV